MYYLQKQGMYSQGVYWIGGSLEEACREADLHALRDADNYHDWEVVRYAYEQSSTDMIQEVVYSIDKFKAEEG